MSNEMFASAAPRAENDAVNPSIRLIAFSAALLCAMPSVAGQPAPAAKTTAAPQHAIPPPEERVDINHAGVDELMKVPGMTRSWAGRIVRFRPYRTKQDLVDRGVLTSEVYERVKDYVIAHRQKE